MDLGDALRPEAPRAKRQLCLALVAVSFEKGSGMAENSKTERGSRVPELDAVRAMAALNLMLFHFTHAYSVKYGFTSPLGFEYSYGKYGTQLFFLLSGYVNAMTLLGKGQPLDFLAARTIRIVPTYLLVLGMNLVLLLFLPFTLHGNYSIAQVLANLTLVPKLLGYECLEPVTWTLQVEILFYAVLLLLYCLGGLQRPVRTLLWYMAVCIAGTWWLNTVRTDFVGTDAAQLADFWEELLLLPYMPLFAIGILLYRLRTGASGFGWNLVGLAAAVGTFHLIDKRDHNPAATFLLIGLIAGAGWGVLPPLRLRPWVFLSSISYSLYLLHNNLGTAFIYYLNQAGLEPWVCFLLVFPFVIGVSALFSFWVERPLSAILRAGWKSWRLRNSPKQLPRLGSDSVMKEATT